MNPNRKALPRALVGMCLALFALAALAAGPAGKWRIELDHRTDNDGAIVLRVAPVGGTPIDVETKVPAGSGENHTADLIRDSLKAALGKDYSVETDDGESVLIKKRGKTPKFEVTLVSSSLTGLTVKVKPD